MTGFKVVLLLVMVALATAAAEKVDAWVCDVVCDALKKFCDLAGNENAAPKNPEVQGPLNVLCGAIKPFCGWSKEPSSVTITFTPTKA